MPQRNTASHCQRRQTTTTPAAARGSLLGRFWLPFCLLFGLAYFAGAQWYYSAAESASRQTRYEQQAIENVALHDRLSGYNPLPPDTDRDVPEPRPETHRALRLELVKEDGSLLKLRLVRSLDWIEAEEAQPGGTVFMDLPEFGAVGEATVTAIEPCPAVPPGSGNLVTGIFEHTSGSVIDLYLEGAAEPIGCTANHRFWSEDREDYVEAGELRPGERVWTRKLGSTAVVGSVPRPGTHRVWNLEVHGEHVYEVGELGVLVHNSYVAETLKPILLGRNISLRVKPVAKAKGFDWYKAKPRKYAFSDRSPAAVAHNVKNNERWLNEQISSGRRIFDIGSPRGYGPSPYYNAERTLLTDQGFKMVRRGPIEVDGIRYQLFEWIK